MKKTTYYYHDLEHDDFASTNISTVTLPDDYPFVDERIPYRVGETLVRVVAFPLIWLILKIAYLLRMKNRSVLKAAKGKGYFVYGNHTNYLLDAYNPTLMAFPRRAHIIVNPDAVSIKGLGTVVKMLGAVPIPTTIRGMRAYKAGISRLIAKKRVIAIYPEAHIWPFYTDIRPFGTQAFHYPVEEDVPSFAFTNIYVRRRLSFIRFPKVVTYIDGPFYPDAALPKAQRIQKLRDEVYAAMKKRVDENEHYDMCSYVYVEDASMTNAKNKKA